MFSDTAKALPRAAIAAALESDGTSPRKSAAVIATTLIVLCRTTTTRQLLLLVVGMVELQNFNRLQRKDSEGLVHECRACREARAEVNRRIGGEGDREVDGERKWDEM